MEDAHVWHTLSRKYVESEAEGRALLANPTLLPFMQFSADAAMNRRREDGYEFTEVHSEPPMLAVNVSDAEVFVGYTHFVQVLTTALMRRAR